MAVLAGRIPELYIAALGALKNGSVFTPLFSAFGPEPIQSRINIARAKVLVTTDALYRKKVEAIRSSLPSLEHVLLVGDKAASEKTVTRPASAHADGRGGQTVHYSQDRSEDAALLHFTSGTTGKPKGAFTSMKPLSLIMRPARFALDFHPDDSSGARPTRAGSPAPHTAIIAPLTHGLTSIVDEADFDAERWYSILRRNTSPCGTPLRPPSAC